jgi:serine/threonine protein kinase
MRELDHPNIVEYKSAFSVDGDTKEENYINIVMEYLPEDIHRIMIYYKNLKRNVPMFLVKVFMYQVFRGLAFLHGKGICHRDIKPQNLLLDPTKNIVKI